MAFNRIICNLQRQIQQTTWTSNTVVTSLRSIYVNKFLLPNTRTLLKTTFATNVTPVKSSNNNHGSVLQTIKDSSVKDIAEEKVFAVVHISGSQFKVAHNDVIMINKKIEAECGDLLKLEKILAVGGRNFTLIGQPLLKRELINVEAMVLEKSRGEKKIVFKKKKRKGYKKWKGHRQDISVLKITKIHFDTDLL